MNNFILRDICLDFTDGQRKQTIFNHFSLAFTGPRLYSLEGPSGCGKTTLLRLLAGEIWPSSGELFIDDEKVYSHLEIAENSELYSLPSFHTLSLKDFLTTKLLVLGNSYKAAEDRIRQQQTVKLNEIIMRNPIAKLSNGEKKLAELCLAAVFPKPMVLLDEPFAGISSTNQKAVIAYLEALAKDAIVVFSLHPQDLGDGWLETIERIKL